MKKNEKYKSPIEKLLPEPQPNNEPLLIGLPSATLAQNALLAVVFLSKFFYASKVALIFSNSILFSLWYGTSINVQLNWFKNGSNFSNIIDFK